MTAIPIDAAGTLPARYRVQSVDRAIDVIEALAAADGGLGVTELARQLGRAKSAVFALLQTLEERGFVESTGTASARRYSLGLALARLGQRAASQVTLLDVALPYLHELTEASGQSSRVAVLSQGAALVVGQVDGPSTVRFDLNMGGRERLHCTGMGKAILAQLDDEAALALVRETGLPKHTARTIDTQDGLLAELATIRARGFAIDDEEDAEGIFCIGAALRDHTGACCGAVSVTGIKARFREQSIAPLCRAVSDAATAISHRLGAPR